MLQNLIKSIEEHLAVLKTMAEKDAKAIEADIVNAKNVVEAELKALLAKLQGL